MTLFSWFNRVDESEHEKFSTIKPIALKKISMWPVAKIRLSNPLLDQAKPINDDKVTDQ